MTRILRVRASSPALPLLAVSGSGKVKLRTLLPRSTGPTASRAQSSRAQTAAVGSGDLPGVVGSPWHRLTPGLAAPYGANGFEWRNTALMESYADARATEGLFDIEALGRPGTVLTCSLSRAYSAAST